MASSWDSLKRLPLSFGPHSSGALFVFVEFQSVDQERAERKPRKSPRLHGGSAQRLLHCGLLALGSLAWPLAGGEAFRVFGFGKERLATSGWSFGDPFFG